MRRCDIAPFGRVGFQVVEELGVRQVERLQLPVPIAHDLVATAAPEQSVMRRAHSLALHEREQIDAVDRPVMRQRRTRAAAGGGENVEMADRPLDRRARLDLRGPAHEERYLDATFEERRLPPAVRFVDVGQADVMRAAIVAGEDHQRVIVQPLRLERRHHAPDPAIERADHRAIDPRAVVGDLRQGVIIGLGRL